MPLPQFDNEQAPDDAQHFQDYHDFEKNLKLTHFYQQIGGMTHFQREGWSLKMTAKLRELMEADICNPKREMMPPATISLYTQIIRGLNEMDARSFRRLKIKELGIIAEPARKMVGQKNWDKARQHSRHNPKKPEEYTAKAETIADMQMANNVIRLKDHKSQARMLLDALEIKQERDFGDMEV